LVSLWENSLENGVFAASIGTSQVNLEAKVQLIFSLFIGGPILLIGNSWKTRGSVLYLVGKLWWSVEKR